MPTIEFWRQMRETKQTWRNTKILPIAPIIASATCITIVKWDAYDVENTAGNARRCHPHRQNSSSFHPGIPGLKCSYGKISTPLIPGFAWEPSQPTLSYERIETFTKDLEVRQYLGKQRPPSQPGSCEEALKLPTMAASKTRIIDQQQI